MDVDEEDVIPFLMSALAYAVFDDGMSMGLYCRHMRVLLWARISHRMQCDAGCIGQYEKHS